MSNPTQLKYDPDVGYTFIPNLKIRVLHESGGYLLQTNDLGFRSGPVDTSDRKQILVFGDSFTAGDGVSNGKRWTDELARLIPRVDVHNFGLPGTGTDQQYLAWRKFAAHRPCDLLVVVVLVENVRRITAAYRPVEGPGGEPMFKAKPYFKLANGVLERHHDPVPVDHVALAALAGEADQGGRFPGLRKFIRKVGLQQVMQSLTAYQPVPDYDDPQSAGWQLMQAILSRWAAECAAPMVIVPLPLYQHVEETADARPYQARFSELAATIGRPVVDPLPALRAHSVAERRAFRFARDVHLTPQGHAATANALAPAIGQLAGVIF